MAFTLFEIWEYYQYTDDPAAKELFDRGIIALKQHIAEYDAGIWSYYDANETLASPHYHQENIRSLAILYEITGEPILQEYSQRWETYVDNPLVWLKRKLLLERVMHFPNLDGLSILNG